MRDTVPRPLRVEFGKGHSSSQSSTLLEQAAQGGHRSWTTPRPVISHSLRIGGAPALLQATSDIELVKRMVRWSSSAVRCIQKDRGPKRVAYQKAEGRRAAWHTKQSMKPHYLSTYTTVDPKQVRQQ